MTGRLARALTALILGATGGVVASSGTAFAAACPAGTGVTVVVNSSVRCDANGGGSAASNFGAAGHSLNSYRGFVCDVDGYPSNDPCRGTAPANAYWGLFWSNGTGGGWNYASQGAYSLNVPKGGWVAFKFQNSSSRSSPGVTPYTAPPAPAPKPKPKATTKPKASSKPKATSSPGSVGAASPSATPSESATPKDAASSKAPSSTPGATASPSAEAAAREEALERTSQESDNSSTSILLVGGVLALALLMGMGFTIWQRRARQT